MAGGLGLQFLLAVVILRTAPGQNVFDWLGALFVGLLRFVDVGAEFVFSLAGPDGTRDTRLLTSFAFGTLSTIIFFSSLMSVLYHLGAMQLVVRAAAAVMRRTLNLSGAESLAVAANVFFGQVEAPLAVRPYLAGMTQSELMAVMLAGFATIAGGVMAAYARMGIDAGHLVTASVISAPAAVVVAKILQPEVDRPPTLGEDAAQVKANTVNLLDAAANGALVGLKLSLQVAAIIIAFLALIAMCEFVFQWALSQFGSELTLRGLLGYVFAPLAWMMGIEAADCRTAGELLGVRMISNEFIAYAEMSGMTRRGFDAQHAQRGGAHVRPVRVCQFRLDRRATRRHRRRGAQPTSRSGAARIASDVRRHAGLFHDGLCSRRAAISRLPLCADDGYAANSLNTPRMICAASARPRWPWR